MYANLGELPETAIPVSSHGLLGSLGDLMVVTLGGGREEDWGRSVENCPHTSRKRDRNIVQVAFPAGQATWVTAVLHEGVCWFVS